MDVNSYSSLAYCYENGIGCEKDEKKAFEYYTKAYDHSDASEDELENIAQCYKKGIGCKRDIIKYIKYTSEEVDLNEYKDEIISLYDSYEDMKNEFLKICRKL